MRRYTFRMKALVWLLVAAAVAGVGYWIARMRRQWAERQQASAARFASFMAQMRPLAAAQAPAAAAPAPAAHEERLLLEAADKASQAGEPVLAIQLYARLLSRFPQTGFAAQARAAVAEQKKRLPKS
jgi:hypothetical protein